MSNTRDKLYQINQVASDGIDSCQSSQDMADQQYDDGYMSTEDHIAVSHALSIEMNRLKAIKSIIKSATDCDSVREIADPRDVE